MNGSVVLGRFTFSVSGGSVRIDGGVVNTVDAGRIARLTYPKKNSAANGADTIVFIPRTNTTQ